MKKKLFIVNLRAIALIAVVIIHVSAPFLVLDDPQNNLIWNFGNLIDSSFRFGVPIFLMISGYLIFSKEYSSISNFLVKRLKKIILPLAFWTIIFSLVRLKSGDDLLLIVKLLRTGVFYHFWYVYMIIGIYLFFPILNSWVNKASKRQLEYFISIWFISCLISSYNLEGFFLNLDILSFSGYMGYTVLGFYLGNFVKKGNYSLIFYLLGALITIFGTRYLSIIDNQYNELFYNYLSPNVILMSIGVFGLFVNLNLKNKRVQLMLSEISDYSFGIYFCHPLILLVLSKMKIDYMSFGPVFGFLITTILCILLSYILIYVLRKITILKEYVG